MLKLNKILIGGCAYLMFLLSMQAATAQEPVAPALNFDSSQAIAQQTDTMKDNQVDLVDVAKWIFKKYPKLFAKRNKRPEGPFFVIFPAPAYSLATGFGVVLTSSISFYTNKKEKENLSVVYSEIWYTQYNQSIALFLTNFYLAHSKYELIGDWRYYNFPTYTYGLGSFTSLSDADRIDYSHARVYETAMRSIEAHTKVGIGYQLDYHWNIKDYNAAAGETTDFVRYGYTRTSASSGPTLDLLYDGRDNPNNPKHGDYLNVIFRQNLVAFGSSTNWSSLIVEYRKYIPAPSRHFKSTIALWTYEWITPTGKPPFLDLPSTGWDYWNDIGRGYVYGRFRGENMLYFEGEYRFPIMNNGLLGGVIFANVESLSEWPSNIFAHFQPSIGAGLRVKMNKKTDSNGCIDYGFGTGGSNGLAFNLNEVF